MKLQQITPHIYWVAPAEETDRPLLGAVIGEQSTLMVDAGNSPDHAQQFLKLLKQYNFSLPEYVALTHWALGPCLWGPGPQRDPHCPL